MKGYGQFCPVAKTAEVFAQRWTPLIVRELCFGAKRFGELADAMPLISRSLLTQRLQELADAQIIALEPLPKGHLYKLTDSGEALRPIVEMMSVWGQKYAQGMVLPADLDVTGLVWSMRRQIEPADIPEAGLVVRFEFRGMPRGQTQRRYWWLVCKRDDIEVCLKDPHKNVDVVISADLDAMTQVWLGYLGLDEAVSDKSIAFSGPPKAIAAVKRILKLAGEAGYKQLYFQPLMAAE